ncbi:MAG: hypothetical protein ACM65K_07890 [Microcoleus sp.]
MIDSSDNSQSLRTIGLRTMCHILGKFDRPKFPIPTQDRHHTDVQWCDRSVKMKQYYVPIK